MIMNESELRAYYEKNGYTLPDDVWELLLEENRSDVDVALQGDTPARQRLLKAGLAILSGTHHKHPGRQSSEKRIDEPIEYDAEDKQYVLAFAEWFAAHANESSVVKSFREMVLGGSIVTTEDIRSAARIHNLSFDAQRALCAEQGMLSLEKTLTDDEANAFLLSPATRILSIEQFREWNIPVIGHKVVEGVPRGRYKKNNSGQHKGEIIALTFDPENNPPGDTFIIRAPNSRITIDGYRLVAGKDSPEYPVRTHCETDREAAFAAMIMTDPQYIDEGLSDSDKKLFSKVKEYLEDKAVFLPTKSSVSLDFEKTLYFWDERGYKAEVAVWPGSVLDKLREISCTLSKMYHWRQADATWFVLTGQIPPFRALHFSTTTIHGGDFNDAFIDMKVQPWVSNKTVHGIFRQIQRRLIGDNRKCKSKNIEIFRFVTRSVGTNPQDSDWEKVRQLWEFKRCYERVCRLLLYPNYKLPDDAD
jgi:hypothetical protein